MRLAGFWVLGLKTRPAALLRRCPARITNPTHRFYDVTPDDRRFLMIRPIEAVSDRTVELVLVENFFEELKAKVGN